MLKSSTKKLINIWKQFSLSQKNASRFTLVGAKKSPPGTDRVKDRRSMKNSFETVPPQLYLTFVPVQDSAQNSK